MSAILSADDLNDFISPGVACIKPIETLPKQSADESNPYQVTTETNDLPPAQISLTDCLACSGCVTSAEAVLVSLQSHAEVLNALDSAPGWFQNTQKPYNSSQGKIFVASVSPQVRASLAAAFSVSEREAGYMIEQLLGGADGVCRHGRYQNRFTWVVDTNVAREICLVAGADEVVDSLAGSSSHAPTKPILSSACPGWICYAEKTHPYILPHLSRLKSPQAISGIILKSTLCRLLDVPPSRIWHLAVMPCFDKKLEASREELTTAHWGSSSLSSDTAIRDVDCVITAREILTLAHTLGLSLRDLPLEPIVRVPFPDTRLSSFLFPNQQNTKRNASTTTAGTSGSYLHHSILTIQHMYPNSTLSITRGRNADVVEYALTLPNSTKPLVTAARYYGFRNIQNLVRRLRPGKISRLPGASRRAPRNKEGEGYTYVEVMACPGGCTNGGGQVRIEDLEDERRLQNESNTKPDKWMQKEWLTKVDEIYYSQSENANESTPDIIDGINHSNIHSIVEYWSQLTGLKISDLLYTTYRKVESDVGKNINGVANLIGKEGGGW